MKSARTAIAMMAAATLAAGCAAGRAPSAPAACSPMPDGQPRPVLSAPYRAGMVLDGDLADWKGIAFTRVTPANGVFDRQPARTDDPADLSFQFAVCHDAEALYVAVEVTDDAIYADTCPPGSISCPAWDDDAVEVFIDGNHNHAPDSRLKDGSELRFGGELRSSPTGRPIATTRDTPRPSAGRIPGKRTPTGNLSSAARKRCAMSSVSPGA